MKTLDEIVQRACLRMWLYDRLPPAERRRIAETNADEAEMERLLDESERQPDGRAIPRNLSRKKFIVPR